MGPPRRLGVSGRFIRGKVVNFSRNAALWIIIVLLLFAWFNFFQNNMSRGPQVPLPYSLFLENVQNGEVSSVTIQRGLLKPSTNSPWL